MLWSVVREPPEGSGKSGKSGKPRSPPEKLIKQVYEHYIALYLGELLYIYDICLVFKIFPVYLGTVAFYLGMFVLC